MDLILWRHAEAEDMAADGLLSDDQFQAESLDLGRCLTGRGQKQAARMAKWLDATLPNNARVMVSPAMRCEQTVVPLGRKYKISPELAPWATAEDLLTLVQWPVSKQTVLVVGHQPTLGQTAACLLGFGKFDLPFRKGALWWLRSRERNGQMQTVVVTVQTPEFV